MTEIEVVADSSPAARRASAPGSGQAAGLEAESASAAQTAPSAAADFIIEAGRILTVDAENTELVDHSVVVVKGLIHSILPHSQARERFPDAPRIDRRGHLLMPGLINTHTHLAMSLLRGFADDLPLKVWLEQHIWPVEARHMSREFVADGTGLALAESLLGGVTTVNDMYFFPDVVAEVCTQVGMRATIGLPILDFPTAWARSSDEYFDRGLAVHDQLRGHPLIRTLFAPHAPYTVSEAPLLRIGMLASEMEIGIHMHVHETAAEVADYVVAHGRRPLQHLHDIGLLTSDLLAVHMTQLSAEEIEMVAAAGCHVIHCPESNLKLASGFCPIGALTNAGVNIAIGTDGAASNNDLDLLGETRTAALVAKAFCGDASAVTADEAIRMMTINPARALGMDNQVGSLETGKAADIICIEPSIGMQPSYHTSSQILYATGRERVRDVWIDGRRMVADRRLETLDAERIISVANLWQQRISRTA